MKADHELLDSGGLSADKRSGQDRRSSRYQGSDSKVLKERLSEARRQARLADQERRAADERAKRLDEEAKELRRHMEEYAGEPQGAPGVDDEELNTLRAELDRVKTEAEGDVDKLRQELVHAQLQASLVADSGNAEEKSRLEGEVDGLIGSLAKREGELGHLRDQAAQAESRRREADHALRQAESRRREADEARKQAEAKRREVEEARGQAEESRRKAEEAREDAEEARRAAEIVVNELRQEIEEETAQHLIEEKAVRSLKLSTASRGRSSLKAVVMGVFLGVLLVISSLYVYLLVKGQGDELFGAIELVVDGSRSLWQRVAKTLPMEQREAEPSPRAGRGPESDASEQAPAPSPAPAPVAKLPEKPPVSVTATPEKVKVPRFQKVTQRDTLPGGVRGPLMIRIPAARYSMGSHQGALFPDEEPPHDVNLRTYYISEAEVSFDDYDRFATATGRPRPDDQGWGRGRQPVVNVNWEDARAYTDWLSQQTGKRYRLPTEAEWEYAAAGESEGFYWWGYKLGYNNAVCFNCGSDWDARQPAPVKSLTPNEYGLHNTAGNVMEWVADCYHKNYYGAPADGSAWVEPNCAFRVARGGAFNRPAQKLRTASRTRHDPQVRLDMLGFRVVRESL